MTTERRMKINAIRIAQQGGVEQMKLESIELAPPKPGEAAKPAAPPKP